MLDFSFDHLLFTKMVETHMQRKKIQ